MRIVSRLIGDVDVWMQLSEGLVEKRSIRHWIWSYRMDGTLQPSRHQRQQLDRPVLR